MFCNGWTFEFDYFHARKFSGHGEKYHVTPQLGYVYEIFSCDVDKN